MNEQAAATEKSTFTHVIQVLSKPITDCPECPSSDDFDPWDIFPALYGSYDMDFDKCAIDVLEEIRDGRRVRKDLAAYMFREMLCTSNLCDYGTSPRGCFATAEFKEILPTLIEKWVEYTIIRWGEKEDSDD